MTSAQLTAAGSAEVIWHEDDKKHKGWTVHLHIGSEVIKHSHPNAKHDTADSELVTLAVEDAKDDGYELNPAAVKVVR
jgi:hypothetical protein